VPAVVGCIAAELRLPLQQLHSHAALGQRHRGRDAGDPTAHDGDPGRLSLRP